MRRWWADANVPSFRLHSISVWGTRSHCELQPAHISTQQLDCCAFWLQECRRLPVRYAVFVSVAGLGFGGAGVTVGLGLCFREHFIFVCHGMAATALQRMFHLVVISRLTYATPAWWGFTSSADRQRIDAVLRRAFRADLWSSAATSEPPTFGDLYSTADDELFNKIVTNSNHILHTLLPSPSTASQHYTVRRRTHSLQLPGHAIHLSNCNCILRMSYKNFCWH